MNISAQLTKRENQIAELMAWGATKKDVANKLFISERTAENHSRSIYEKTGVTKVNELSAWWFCKNFNISLDFSPFKRKTATYILLMVVSINIAFDHDLLRIRRSRRNKENEIEQIIYE